MRLAREGARELFAGARVARLATVSEEGRPHVVPVTFAVDGELIYTAVDAKPKSTTNLRRISNIRASPDVAMLADHYSDDWQTLWWARADGRAAILASPAGMMAALRLLAARYPQYRTAPPPGPVIAVTVASWSGWRAGPASD